MKKLYFLITLIISSGFSGCGNSDPYANLDKAEQKAMYQKAIEREVGNLLCNTFITEAYDYEKAKTERKFMRFYVYFTDYSKRFERLKSDLFYPIYKHQIGNILKAKGLQVDIIEFDDMPLPEVKNLGCDDAVNKWVTLRDEWAPLERTLPEDFFVK